MSKAMLAVGKDITDRAGYIYFLPNNISKE